MNNSQDNFNNPHLNNNNITNQNNHINNSQQELNVIPTNNGNNVVHQIDDSFINKNINQPPINMMNMGFENTNETNFSQNDLEDKLTIQHQNKFINNNIDTTSTSLNNLNVAGEYHDMPKVDYSQDPKVKENMQKKNTVTITSEGKIFLIIVAILLIFIFVLPTIFDLITNISYS